jgi:indole-3-glycerol phosphate synthase
MTKMSILQRIVDDKRREVETRLGDIQETQLRRLPSDSRRPLDFKQTLRTPGLAMIAEVKKASPSKGIIRADFDPVSIARSYVRYGCHAISVLTEEQYFQGRPEILKSIRNAVEVPLLRKDFLIDLRQVRETYDLGADAFLLIMAILKAEETIGFLKLAAEFGLAALVEVHTRDELETALSLDCDLIGINNRDLSTFRTDIRHSIALRKRIPEGVVCVSESGIRNTEDCQQLYRAGFDAVLVGEALMRQEPPGASIPQWLAGIT